MIGPSPVRMTQPAVHAAMLTMYERLPFGLQPRLAGVFAALDHAAPGAAIVHCTAGKDRTGVAVALVLESLGVRREAIVEDYTLTNTAVDLRSQLLGPGWHGRGPRRDGGAHPGVVGHGTGSDAGCTPRIHPGKPGCHRSAPRLGAPVPAGRTRARTRHARAPARTTAHLNRKRRRMRQTKNRMFGGLAALLLCAGEAQAAAVGAEIPAPQDVPYPGVIQLQVDATDLDHRVFRVKETLPVAGPGRTTLLYPKWLPGNHSTTGPIDKLAGLIVRSNDGRAARMATRPGRDACLPRRRARGRQATDLEFEFVTPTDTSQGRVTMTPDLLGLQWEKTLLYPAGFYARQIPVAASVQLPAGWQFASALRGAQRAGDTVQFATVPLETLVDSPLFAGPHYRRVELDAEHARSGAAQYLRRHTAGTAGHGRAARQAPSRRRRGGRAVRLPPLPRVRLPARDQRPLHRHRARAPRVERERRRARLFHRLGQQRQRSRPAGA